MQSLRFRYTLSCDGRSLDGLAYFSNGQVLPKPRNTARCQILEYLKTNLWGIQEDAQGVYDCSLTLAGRDGHLRLEFLPEESPVSSAPGTIEVQDPGGLIRSVTNIKEPYATPDPPDQYTRPVLASGGDVSSTNDTHQNGDEEASTCELPATSNTLQGVKKEPPVPKTLPRAQRGPTYILSQTQCTKGKRKPFAAVEGSCWPCKKRKRRCNLAKPTCRQCARKGISCDYNAVLLRWDSMSAQHLTVGSR